MPQLRKRKTKENVSLKVKKGRKEEFNISKSASKKNQTETSPISKTKTPNSGVKRKKKDNLLHFDEELQADIIKNKKAVRVKSSCNKENIKLEEITVQDNNAKAEPNDSHSLNFSSFTDSGIASENLSDFINETIIKSELSSSFSSYTKQNKEDDLSNSESDWEEVEDICETNSLDDYKPEIPKEGVEITIDCPELRIKKRRKKKFDRNEWIRLHINRIRKETQLYIHKTHLLCLLARGLYVNQILNSSTIKNFALSLIPNHMFTFTAGKKIDKIDVHGIEKIVSWFRSVFSFEQKNCIFINPFTSLIKSFQTTVAMNVSEYNLLFIAFARTLGFKVRYCVSLYPLPLKASNLLKKPKKKKNSEKSRNPDVLENINDKKPDVKKSECLEKSKKEEKVSKISKQKKKFSRVKKKNFTENKEKNVRSLRSNFKNHKLSSNEDNDDTIDEDFESDYDSHGEDLKKEQNIRFNRRHESKNKTLNSKIRRPRRSTLKSYKLSSDEDDNDTNDEDFKVDYDSSDNDDFKTAQKIKFKRNHESRSRTSNRKILSSESSLSFSQQSDLDTENVICWAEVYSKAEKSWISIECANNIINKPYAIESVALKPVSYILAFDNESFVKDVTRRYCNEYMTTNIKLRIDSKWWEDSLNPFLPPNSMQNKEEEKKLEEMLVNKPLPTSIQGFKNHPLYALKRHLLKFEGIYPPDAPPVGFIRGEPIYARDCVHLLHPREKWLKKEARVVKIGEQPYKIVKCPRWDKINRVIKKGVPIELFGVWQTEEYEPPTAVNGIVPRNEYGNVDLFKHSMLPRGTVYLNLPGLNRIAKKVGIDCSPAIVGFECKNGFPHPRLEGFVICEEFKDKILAAWDEEQENIKKKEKEKHDKRVYGNWKKLIKGLLIHERIKLKYNIDSKETK